MDASRFDSLAVTRSSAKARSRRGVLGGLMLGTIALLGVSDARETAAKKRKSSSRNSTLRRCQHQLKQSRTQLDTCRTRLTPHQCAGQNWCVDRTQTCGPADGYGKCLVLAEGGNICAEILFQVNNCDDCLPANCTNCRCVLAAGGGDRCNNGANGYDYICVREV